MNKFWPFSFNFFLFAGVAFFAPFFVLYYQELGFTGTQIGLLTGITPLVTFFSAALWTGFADRTRQHRLLMSIAMLGCVIGLFLLPQIKMFAPMLLFAVTLNLFWAPVSPFADNATMHMLADQKEMYSRVRLGATIGFGLTASIAGIFVQNYGLKAAFWGGSFFFFLGFLVTQKLVHGQPEEKKTEGQIWALLKNPRWLLFLVIAFAGGAAVAAYNNYLFPYMKELGASEATMGLALTIGMFAEIPILFFGNRLIKRLGSYRLLMLSIAATGLRMLLFAATDQPNFVLAAQLLNGLTYPIMWVAGVSYADEHAPEGMSATAQGIFTAMVLGFGTAAGGFIGGPLLENAGGRSLYLVFGIAVLSIATIVALVQRRLPASTTP